MNNTLNHIMVDIETLSTQSDAVIVSIAAVKFSLTEPEQEDFIININPLSGKEYGLHISKETVDWWSIQKPEAIKSWQHSQIHLPEALDNFLEFTGSDKNTQWWCNGLNFDYPILDTSIRVTGRQIPWKYWNLRDVRTAYYLANFNTLNAKRIGDYHSALDDCKTQIAWLKHVINQ